MLPRECTVKYLPRWKVIQKSLFQNSIVKNDILVYNAAIIRIDQEIQSLPYAGFFVTKCQL